MKKLFVALGAVGCVGLGTVVTRAASTTGTPEIDRANATLQLSGSLSGVRCTGEDGMPYETFTGSYKGGESQMTPDATDYNLGGGSTVNSVSWTVNLTTFRGVFTGTIALTNAAGTKTYMGNLVLITQGNAGTPPSNANARGWINASFLGADDGVTTSPNDDRLLANVEFKLTATSATGQFGTLPSGGTLGFKDLSVVTNVPGAPDGVC